VSNREGQSEELTPQEEAGWERFVKHFYAVRRGKTKRRALAFLVIVAYGWLLSGFAQTHDALTAKHPNLLNLFWAVFLGVIAFAFVLALLTDDYERAGDEPLPVQDDWPTHGQ